MSGSPRLSREQAELLIAGSFVVPSAARDSNLENALRRFSGDARAWSELLLALERHGVLGLFASNRERVGVPLPAETQVALDARWIALQEDGRRFQFTLLRVLREARREGVSPILLKGASLAQDVYREPGQRGQGDLDLLVATSEVPALMRAGERAGLLMQKSALPAWWYRLAHFHLKLAPTAALLREVEVHWALHHPASLLTPDMKALRARCIPRRVGSETALDLHPADRWLHLVTHLESHVEDIGNAALAGEGMEWLLDAVSDPGHALRIKWMVDLVALLDGAAESGAAEKEVSVSSLLEHAAEWGAEDAHLSVLTTLEATLGLTSKGQETAATLIKFMRNNGASLKGTTHALRGSGKRPVRGLDFRVSALGRLPRWVWPPSEYLRRRYAGRLGRRALHTLGVALKLLFTAAALPLALVGSNVIQARRGRALRLARAPEFVLELATDWRRTTRAWRTRDETQGALEHVR